MKAIIIINILLLMSLAEKTFSKAVRENPGEIDLSQFGNQLFGSPDKAVGKSVKEWKNNKGSSNPEELGTYLEGDILFPSSRSRNGLVDKSYYWEDEVPYEVVGDFDNDEVAMVQEAMDAFHGNTCIKFVPKSNKHEDYISIRNTESGCWSSIGKVGGMQVVNLQKDGCLFTIGTPIHEFLHALGFTHLQNSEDRDDYVKIIFQNVQDGKEHNFKKATRETTSNFDVRYDYGSVMHYSSYAFTKNRRPTIKIKRSYDGKLGQRDGFSKGDIKKVWSMYQCKSTTASTGYKNKVTVTPMDTSGEVQD